jgi:hypothetical protein
MKQECSCSALFIDAGRKQVDKNLSGQKEKY